LTLTGERPLRGKAVDEVAVAGEFGNEFELEMLSSNSDRWVDTDRADPELTDPVPRKNGLISSIHCIEKTPTASKII
jgi:hypothetical protein